MQEAALSGVTQVTHEVYYCYAFWPFPKLQRGTSLFAEVHFYLHNFPNINIQKVDVATVGTVHIVCAPHTSKEEVITKVS